MRSLADVQATLAAALLDRGPEQSAGGLVSADGLAPDARIAIYRHHVFSSLTEALGTTFPVIRRLVGDGFFAYAAHEFIRDVPPSSPCVAEYGDRFPDFLAGFPQCTGLPYLPDVARLEWAMNRALHAEDVVPLDPAVLGRLHPHDVGRVVVQFEPSITWLSSPWPVDEIWRANQPDADTAAIVSLDRGGAWLEVRRVEDDVVYRALSPADWTLRHTLSAGATLAHAVDAALAHDPRLDVPSALAALFGDGVLAGYRLTINDEE